MSPRTGFIYFGWLKKWRAAGAGDGARVCDPQRLRLSETGWNNFTAGGLKVLRLAAPRSAAGHGWIFQWMLLLPEMALLVPSPWGRGLG